jgi:hypothetical protein
MVIMALHPLVRSYDGNLYVIIMNLDVVQFYLKYVLHACNSINIQNQNVDQFVSSKFRKLFTLVVLVILERKLWTNKRVVENFDVKVDVQKGVLTFKV